jgi:peptidoglycan/xylan/chitin deacetylase (PgdA/CDA1 family)
LHRAALPTSKPGRAVDDLLRPPFGSTKRAAKASTRARWAQGRTINHVTVRREDKVFALTFDDGPWPRYTRQVLKVLKSRKVKATFFMVGQEVARRPEVAREVLAAGHVIGNHSWDHPSRPRNAASEVKKTDEAILRATGVKSMLFRPPYGIVRNGMAAQAMRQKQTVVMWSADSGDWKRGGATAIANRVLRQASRGGIALLHDGGGDRAATVAALPSIIDGLHARGYRLVTIPELLALRHVPPDKPRRALVKNEAKVQEQKAQPTNARTARRAYEAAAATKARAHLSKR